AELWHRRRKDRQGTGERGFRAFSRRAGGGKIDHPRGSRKACLISKRKANPVAKSERVRKKREHRRASNPPGCSFTKARGYSWTGQRKSADAFLVTVTVPALWAARTAAWEVRSTGVASGLNVTVKTFQWPP